MRDRSVFWKKRELVGNILLLTGVLSFSIGVGNASNSETYTDYFVAGPSRAFQCNKDGFFRDPYNCTIFYRCADVTGSQIHFQLFQFDCPPGTVYDEGANLCNHPSEVPVCTNWFAVGVVHDDGFLGPLDSAVRDEPIGMPVPGSEALPVPFANDGDGGAAVPGPIVPSVSSDVASLICERAGLSRSPYDCRRFQICVDIFGNGTMYQLCEYPCPLGTVFSNRLALCTDPENAEPCQDVTTTSKPGPSTTTAPPTTPWPPSPPDSFRCMQSGYYRHPTDCRRYYQCVNLTEDGRVYQRFEFMCGQGAVFDESVSVCNHPSAVPGCSGAITLVTTVATFRPPLSTSTATSSGRPGTTLVPPVTPTSTGRPVTPPTGFEVGETSTVIVTTARPPVVPSFECVSSGIFPHPTNCSRFFRCHNITAANDRFIGYEFSCGRGTVFDPAINNCNHPGAVPGCMIGGVRPPPGSTTRPPWTTSSTSLPVTSGPPVTLPPITIAPLVRPPPSTAAPPVRPPPSTAGPPVRPPPSTVAPPVTSPPSTAAPPVRPPPSTAGPPVRPPPSTAGPPVRPPPSTVAPPPTAPEVGHTSTATIPVSTGRPPVWPPPPVIAGPECRISGLIPHPTNCSRFYHCVNLTEANDRFLRYEFNCGVGTVFDPALGVCNHPGAVPGCGHVTIGTATPPTSTVTPVTPLPPTGSTFAPPVIAGPECRISGLIPHPTNCSRFYQCANLTVTNDRFLRYEFSCSIGMVFDPVISVCNHPNAVPGCGHVTIGTVTPPTSTLTPVTPLPPTGSTIAPPVIAGPECRISGLIPHPTNCSRFYQCANLTVANDRFLRYEFSCGVGTVFDPVIDVCNHPNAVPGCGHVTIGTVTPPPSTAAPPVTPPPTVPEVGYTSTVTVPVSTDRPPVWPPPPVIAGPECRISGLIPHPTNCSRFYRCVNLTEANDRFLRYEFSCGIGTVFDPAIRVCNHPGAVPGCASFTVRPLPPVTGTVTPQPPVTGLPVTSVPITLPTSTASPTSPRTVPPVEPEVGETSTIVVPVTTVQPPIQPTGSPPTRPVIAGSECKISGNIPHPTNCSRFYLCVNLTEANDRFLRYEFSCGIGTVFDPAISVCNHPGAVPRCAGVTGQPRPPVTRPVTSVPITVPTSTVSYTTPPTMPPVGPEVGETSTIVLPVSTVSPPIEPTGTPWPPPVIAGPECKISGLIPHPTNCSRYYHCANLTVANDQFIRYEFSCGIGTVFDPVIGLCNHPSAVPGCAYITIGTVTPPTAATVTPAPPTGITVTAVPPIGSTLPPPVIAGPECKISGLISHPTNCSRFYQCANITVANDRFIRYEFQCGPGTVFDPAIGVCNHPSVVPGCGHVTVGTVTPTTGATVTPAPPITAVPPTGSTLLPPVIAGKECKISGPIPHPTNCSRFYQCSNITVGNDWFIRYEFDCSPGTVFDPAIGVCNYPSAVPRCAHVTVGPVTITSRPWPPVTVTGSPVTQPVTPVPPITAPPTEPEIGGTSTIVFPVTTDSPIIGPTGTPWPRPVIAGPECKISGHIPHPTNCSRFYRCVNLTEANDRFLRYEFSCGVGTVFDPAIGVCNHPGAVPGCAGVTRPPQPPVTITSRPLPPVTVTSGPWPPITVTSRPSPTATVTGRPVTSGPVTQPVTPLPPITGPTAPPTVPEIGGTSTIVLPVTTASPIIGPTGTPWPRPVIAGPECKISGHIPNPSNCSRFYRCVNLTEANDRFLRYEFSCGVGTVFDPAIGVCNHPGAVPRCAGVTRPPQPPVTITSRPLPPVTVTSGPWPPITVTSRPSPTATVTGRPVTSGPVTQPVTPLPPITGPTAPPTVPEIGGTSTIVLPVTTASPIIGPTGTPWPRPVIAGPECKISGHIPNPSNCSRFYRCVNLTEANDRFLRYEFSCGVGTVFDPAIGVCNHPGAVPRCAGVTRPPQPPVTITSRPLPPVTVTSGPWPPITVTSRPSPTVTVTGRPVTSGPVTQPVTPLPLITGPTAPPTVPEIGGTSTIVLPVTTASPIIGPTGTPWPRPVIAGPECKISGHIPHPTNCSRFYRCVNLTETNDRFLRYEFSCGIGTVFDPAIGVCNHPAAVPGCAGVTWPPRPPVTITGRPVTGTPVPPVTGPTAPPTVPEIGEISTIVLPGSTVSPPIKPTGSPWPIPPVIAGPECRMSGLIPHPSNCSRYYQCANLTEANDRFLRYEFSCGLGTVFDPAFGVCNHPSAVPGCGHVTIGTPTPPTGLPTGQTPGPVVTTVTPAPPIGSTLPPPVIAGPECRRSGLIPHPTNCARFYQCANITAANDRFIRFEFSCGIGTVFDPAIGVCNHPSAVPRCAGFTWPTGPPVTSGPVTRPVTQTPSTIGPTAPPTAPVIGGLSTIVIPASTVPPTVPPTGAPWPRPVIAGSECTISGFISHPSNCSRFYQCVNLTEANDRFLRYEFSCGIGTVFDPVIGVCNHPAAVPRCAGFTVRPLPPVTVTSDPRPPTTVTGRPATSLPVTPPVTAVPPTRGPTAPPTGPVIGGSITTIVPLPTVRPPSSTPTPLPPGPECRMPGLFPHPTNCSRFYRCANLTAANDRFVRYEFSCGSGTVFDPAISVCNHPGAVPRCSGYTVEPPTPTSPIPGSTTSPGVPVTPPTESEVGGSTTIVITVPIVSPTPGPTETTVAPPVIAGPECRTAGSFPNVTNCSRFYRCVNIPGTNDQFVRYDFQCRVGAVFDPAIGVCNHPSAVPGCEGYAVTSRPTTLPPPTTTSGGTLVTIVPVPPDGAGLPCTRDGFFRHPTDCGRFVRCVLGNATSGFRRYEFVCGSGSAFDETLQVCAPPSTVRGCETYVAPPTSPCPNVTTPTSASTPPTAHIIQNTATPPTTPEPPCHLEGYFRHPHNCSQFYRCVDLTGNATRFQRVLFYCPPGTVFDELIGACNFPHLAPPCDISPNPTFPTTSASTTTTTTTTTTTASTSPTTTEGAPSQFVCTDSGKYQHRTDCSKFYLCQDLFGNGKKFHMCEVTCPEGTNFDDFHGYCSERVSPTDCLTVEHDLPSFPNFLDTLPSHYAALLKSRLNDAVAAAQS